jgi:glycosyltransferase involved in cell wall biosynthesis
MRVGIVTPRYPPNASGGGEVSVQMLAEQLEKKERITDVLVLSFDGKATEEINEVSVRRLGDISPTVTEWQNIRVYPHLEQYVDKFDVIHAYNMELHPVVGAVAGDGSTATVGTLNSYHFFPKSVANTSSSGIERLYELVGHPITNRILQHFMKKMDRFIAISNAVRSVYVERGYDPTQIEVIPNMVDPSFDTDQTSGTESESPAKRVLYVGELSERKGVHHLIKSIGSLSDDFHLRVVGDGAEREALEELVDKIGATERVTFTGWVPYEKIPGQYAFADVFVHSGVWPEPFGRTVLEAMQSGLPVVCTEVGGPADVVRDAELRVQPGDPKELATAIERAYDRKEDIGRQNQVYVTDEFGPDAVTNQIVDLYEQVIECSR